MADGNPFDTPLASEVQDHQQAQTATVQASHNGNPFDEPLLSEKAEAQAKAKAAANPEQEASNTRQMLVAGLTGMPTPNMTEADRASFEKGKAAGAISVPVVAGALAAPGAFGPVTDKVVEYLPHLARIIKTARDLSLTGFGLKEAHDLYKWVADSK